MNWTPCYIQSVYELRYDPTIVRKYLFDKLEILFHFRKVTGSNLGTTICHRNGFTVDFLSLSRPILGQYLKSG
jgi:hypothetical protein